MINYSSNTFKHFFSPGGRAEKNSWHCPTCALVLILFCLAGCNPAAEQVQVIDYQLDVIHVPEGGTVEGRRVHKGVFMTENRIKQDTKKIIEKIKHRANVIAEERRSRLWGVSTQ